MSVRSGPVRVEAVRPTALVRATAPAAVRSAPRRVPATPARRREPLAHAVDTVVVAPKLVVGSAHDPLEHEADRIAALATARPAPTVATTSKKQPAAQPSGTSGGMPAGHHPFVQRAGGTGPGTLTVEDPAVTAQIRAPPSGTIVPDSVRSRVEPLVGCDLSMVRVHDAASDRALPARLGARAFTVGTHIWLGPGESRHDLGLMAHELTHVAQAGPRGPPVVRRMLGGYPTSLDEVITWARTKVRAKLVALPSYDLICLVAGRDLVTDASVERSASTVLRAFLKAADQLQRYESLERSGQLQAAFAWVMAELEARQLTPAAVLADLAKVWRTAKAIDVAGLVTSPVATTQAVIDAVESAFNTVKGLGGRLLGFAGAVAKKLAELAVNALMEAAGPFGKRVVALVQKAGKTLDQLIDDPVRFGMILLRALGEGFSSFGKNFLSHLEGALVSWLFGELKLKPPPKLDLKGVLNLALDVLGLTWTNVRERLVKKVGEPIVKALETAVDFVVVLVRDGLAGVWQKIVGWIDNLWDTVIGAVKNWVVETVVKKALMALAKLLSPVGAIVEVLMGVYAAVSQFIAKAEKYLSLAERVVDGFARVVGGDTSAAAAAIEDGLGRALSLMVDFLARQQGIDGIAKHIRNAITSARGAVDKAIDKLIDYLVGLAGKIKAGVTSWWKRSVAFRAGGEQHKVSFKGEGASAVLMIESTPRDVPQFVAAHRPLLGNVADVSKRTAAGAALDQMVAANAKINTERDKGDAQNAAAIGAATDVVTAQAKIVLDAVAGDQVKGELRMGPTRSDGAGTFARVVIVPDHKLAVGSPPQTASALWKHVRRFPSTKGGSTYFIRGHLVNHNLFGPGKDENMTPITRAANGQHSTKVENTVKALANKVNKKKGDVGGFSSLTYEVTAEYGSGTGGALARVHPVPGRFTKTDEMAAKTRETVLAIERTPVAFRCTWEAIHPTEGKSEKGGEVIATGATVPTEYPAFDFREDLVE